jgi:hypothetical protein
MERHLRRLLGWRCASLCAEKWIDLGIGSKTVYVQFRMLTHDPHLQPATMDSVDHLWAAVDSSANLCGPAGSFFVGVLC